jgi:hypothetical protein
MKNTKESLNTPKRATTGSIQLPRLTDAQLYWMRKMNTKNSKTDLETYKNHQYTWRCNCFSPHTAIRTNATGTIWTQSTLKQSDQNPAKNPWILLNNHTSPNQKTNRISHLRTKRRKKLQSDFKNIHYSINPEETKTEIEKLGHAVSNIWNIKQYRTELPISMLFVELKPAPNNKDIYKVEYLQQCRIKFDCCSCYYLVDVFVLVSNLVYHPCYVPGHEKFHQQPRHTTPPLR